MESPGKMSPAEAAQAAWLDEVQSAVEHGTAQQRAAALRELSDRAAVDPSLTAPVRPALRTAQERDRARAIFRAALHANTDRYVLAAAAIGLQHVADAPEVERTWRTLLAHRDPDTAALAVVSIEDPAHAPLLMEALSRRSEPVVRLNAMSVLGRMKHLPAVPLIVSALGDCAIRPHAIWALGEMGDLAAIETIRPFLGDGAPAWPVDNHGPMMTVGDVAREAITKLGGNPRQSLKSRIVSNITPTTTPQPQLPTSARLTRRLLVYLPIAVGFFEVIWIGALFVMGQASRPGRGPTAAESRDLELFAALPPIAAITLGLVVLMRRWASGRFEYGVLTVGLLMCACWIYALSVKWS